MYTSESKKGETCEFELRVERKEGDVTDCVEGDKSCCLCSRSCRCGIDRRGCFGHQCSWHKNRRYLLGKSAGRSG